MSTRVCPPSDLSQSSDEGTTNTLSLLFFSVLISTNPAVGRSTFKLIKTINNLSSYSLRDT